MPEGRGAVEGVEDCCSRAVAPAGAGEGPKGPKRVKGSDLKE